MRESIGGAWLFGIVITFIVLFTGFLTYSISYTRAFNVKNEIINYIEQNEGFSKSNSGNIENPNSNEDNSVQAKAYTLIKNTGYNYEAAENNLVDSQCPRTGSNQEIPGIMQPGGYCIKKLCKNGNPNMNTQYKVTTFIALEIPVIGFQVRIPISGETRTIYYDSGNFECWDEEDI